MGARYKSACKNCHHEFELNKGGGWLWYQKVCNACGRDMKIPRHGPETFPKDSMGYLDLVKHLADGPVKWSRRGLKFDASERQMLDEITSVCACGGALISETDPDVIYRCPECKSTDLDLGDYILFD